MVGLPVQEWLPKNGPLAESIVGDRRVNVFDLSLCVEGRRALQGIVATRGLDFFWKAPSDRALRLDDRRIAWVVEVARRRTSRHRRDRAALARTHRLLRRELICRLAQTMVECGL